MLYDDSIKFYKIEQKRFTNSTCVGSGKYIDIAYDKNTPGMFWVKDTAGNVTGFHDHSKSKCVEKLNTELANIQNFGINDLYYVMTSDSLYIGESMESLRAFPHLQGSLTVLPDSLFAINTTIYKNMYGYSQPVAESSSSSFNSVLIIIGVAIVCFFLYRLYSVKSQKDAQINKR